MLKWTFDMSIYHKATFVYTCTNIRILDNFSIKILSLSNLGRSFTSLQFNEVKVVTQEVLSFYQLLNANQ